MISTRWILVFTAAIALCSLACDDVRHEMEVEGHEVPGEFLFQQRAFPFDSINRSAMLEGLKKWEYSSTLTRSQEREWKNIGPTNIGGRITALALHPVDTNLIYVGGSVGGVWRSNDCGVTWSNIFDEPGGLSIGALAISKSDPEILYVGTGEANASATSGAFFGNGVYRTTDGGDSWEYLGLEASSHIGRIVIDSEDPDRAFVAAGGLLYGKNEERGVYRTTDGGQTWERTLFVSDSTACIDIVISPANDQLLFAAFWERLRYPYSRSYSGITSGVHRSTDGGETWTRLGAGLPTNENVGRIGLAMSPADSNIVYAVYTTNPSTNRFDALYKSVNKGNTWLRVDDGTLGGSFSSFGWFFANVRTHPTDANQVFILGLHSWKSLNGGRNWEQLTTSASVHVDQHAMQFHPAYPNIVVAGNDGGVYISHNSGEVWSHSNTLPISQFYATAIDPQNSKKVYGGMQDNGTAVTRQGYEDGWDRIFGGDGFRVVVDPTDSNMIYAEAQNGYIVRSFDGGQSFLGATFGIELDDRNNWNTPIVINPQNSRTLFTGTQRLYTTFDRAGEWHPISTDLTDPVTSANDFGTISTIAVAPSDTNVIYVGTDDGFVQVTTDFGASWTLISSDLPRRYITSIAVDKEDAQHAYVTLSGFRAIEYIPHVYETNDGGFTWTDISGNLPEVPVNDIIIDPEFDGTLYVATDQGVWHTFNGGETWEVLGTGFPATVVNDLDFHVGSRILVAATFGRSQFTYELNEVSASAVTLTEVESPLIHPNPTKGRFQYLPGELLDNDLDVQMISANGVLVDRRKVTWHDGVMEFDGSQLPAGIYLLRITDGKRYQVGRVVITD